MEVILRQDVDKVGLRGEVVNVTRGYARNFLFPRGLADEATPARVAELRKVEEHRARHEAKTFEDAQAVAERLGKVELRFDVKAGPTGSLFGSVTPTDIADDLWTKHKVRVDRRKIAVDSIKRIGRYQVPIELFQDVTAEVRKVEERRAQHEAKTFEEAQKLAERLGQVELRFDVKAGPTGSLFGSVTPTDIADDLWTKHKVRVDRRKIAVDSIKRIGRYQVPIELFQDVTAEVRTLVVPEGGELPPEEELEAMAAAEEAAQAEPEQPQELDLEELDAAALAQEAELTASGELQPSREDVAEELPADDFDRAVDAGASEEQQA